MNSSSYLSHYIYRKFGIDEAKFQEVLEMSPGAEGYLLGSLGELLFKEYAERLGYEALRIKEKPEGGDNAKSEDARGDFYIRRRNLDRDEWFVIECKGVKSNAEKRLNLTSLRSCFTILAKHSIKRNDHLVSIYNSGKRSYETAKLRWEHKYKGTFPAFRWSQENPGSCIPNLTGLWKSDDEINDWLASFPIESFSEDAYWDLRSPIRVLQTHMPSTRVDPISGIKSTGPLVTEFNILCVDLFIKTGEHQFVFANSEELNHQGSSPNHLQQNYTIDILTQKDSFALHNLLHPWYFDLDQCIRETLPRPRIIDRSQLDRR